MGGLMNRLVGGGPLGNVLEDGWNGMKNIPVIGGFFDAICQIIEPEMHQQEVVKVEEPPATFSAAATYNYTPPAYSPHAYTPPTYSSYAAPANYAQPSYSASYAAAANLVSQDRSIATAASYNSAPSAGSWGQASALSLGN